MERPTMHLHPGNSHRLHTRIAARELLGSAHPLTLVEDKLTALYTRSLVVAALLCAGIAALLDGLAAGLPLTIAAAVVEAALGCRAVLLGESRREHALELIAQGHGDLPIEAVARQRRRLVDPARRRCLAKGFDVIRDEALHPPPPQARVRPIFDRRLIMAAAPELATIARLLRDDTAGLRGIAIAQQLLTQGGSPLYRSNLRLLREELQRIHYHLLR
jgi:hypothetical protein